jgi:hypothetical protein
MYILKMAAYQVGEKEEKARSAQMQLRDSNG